MTTPKLACSCNEGGDSSAALVAFLRSTSLRASSRSRQTDHLICAESNCSRWVDAGPTVFTRDRFARRSRCGELSSMSCRIIDITEPAERVWIRCRVRRTSTASSDESRYAFLRTHRSQNLLRGCYELAGGAMDCSERTKAPVFDDPFARRLFAQSRARSPARGVGSSGREPSRHLRAIRDNLRDCRTRREEVWDAG